MGTFTNSKDPDEMPHNAASHQGLHLFVKVKKIFRQKNTFFLKIYKLTPLDMNYVLSQVYCIRPEGRIH